MSELRDRIAAAIKAADKRVAGFISYEERADAVIRDVLTPEFLADLVITAVQKAADDE
jgi:hypothetical protein